MELEWEGIVVVGVWNGAGVLVVQRSRTHSLMYSIIARMSNHRPSARKVICGVFCLALSVAQPARAL